MTRCHTGVLIPLRPIILFFIFVGFAESATVLSVSFPQLCTEADLIFEGQVIHVESRRDGPGGGIWTYVTWKVIEAIKGPNLGAEVELAFLGGSVGEWELKVGGLRTPELDERGIYFVETLRHRVANPLLGWDQGHFLVEVQEGGIERVLTPNRRFVYFLDKAPVAGQRGLSNGVAVGLRAEAGSPGLAAVTVKTFKERVRQELVNRSKGERGKLIEPEPKSKSDGEYQ